LGEYQPTTPPPVQYVYRTKGSEVEEKDSPNSWDITGVEKLNTGRKG